jgi:hypothetical protein
MMNRVVPDAEPGVTLAGIETAVLDRGPPTQRAIWDLASYVRKIARLNGWLARAGDPQPGNLVLGHGRARLTDIDLGATLVLD